MRIVDSNQPRPTITTSGTRRRRIAWTLLFLGYSVFLIVIGAKLYRDDFFSGTLMPYARSSWKWPVKRLHGALAAPKTLEFDLKWEDFQQLSYQRELALRNQFLLSRNNNFVNATITADGHRVNARMRLKGDNIDHLRGEKWSFRVSVRGDNTVFGMKQFSLHHPRARNWIFEWIGQRLMQREGVVALRYEFVDVSINGKHLGIYALEEHFEKRLIEHNQRREGPILRFDEEPMWTEINSVTRPFRGASPSGNGDYLASAPDGFGTKSALADPDAHALYIKAVHLLEQFRRGELPTSKVFDASRLAVYFALVDLLGGEHGARWHNIRFYYNPVTGLLEPIAFDLNAGQPIRSLSILATNPSTTSSPFPVRYEAFQKRLFEDIAFRNEYLRALSKFAQPEFLDRSLAELEPELNEALAILYREFPYYDYAPRVLYRNQEYVRTILAASDGLHANFVDRRDGLYRLRVGNTRYLPLSIVGLEIDEGAIIRPVEPMTLEPRRLDRPVEYVDVDFDAGDSSETPDVSTWTLVYAVPGSRTTARAPVSAHSPLRVIDEPPDLLRRDSNIDAFDFLVVDEARRSIAVMPGRWEIREPLLLPAGYTVLAGPGTALDLRAGSLILARSPLFWMGTEEAPIVIHTSDGTGQGLVVLSAGERSELESVRFEGLTNPDRNGWVLTGAVTFYESPVSFDRCVFTANKSEDGLNVIRSDFRLRNTLFTDTASDAFDGDFCTGIIENCTFLRCTNDGVDVSGSVVAIKNLTVNGSRDKAVSVGEASRVTLDGLTATGVRIALASKDRSELFARNVTLIDCDYGLAAFRKKPEFGPAVIHALAVTVRGVRDMYLVEQGSTVYVDDRPTFGTRTDVKEIVYGPESGVPPKPNR